MNKETMTELSSCDRKHEKILVLCFLCMGIYLYLYANVNVSMDKIEHIGGSTLKRLNQLVTRRVSQDEKATATRDKQKCAGAPGVTLRSEECSTSKRILTMFTSWSKSGTTCLLRNNTALNWGLLSPYIHPVLFTNDTGLAVEVQKLGWDSLPVTHAAVGVPVLKHMYLTAMKRYRSPLYAYVNGDILFTQTLVETLSKVLQSELYNKSAVLVVGRRTNLLNVTRPLATNFLDLTKAAVSRGNLFTVWGIDYFITSQSFPWADMPDVVIGRVAYDNFLVVESNKRNITTIDATKTLLAVHQTTKKGGNYEGHRKPQKDFNSKLLAKIYKRINYAAGTTNGARYFTKYNYKSEVCLVKR